MSSPEKTASVKGILKRGSVAPSTENSISASEEPDDEPRKRRKRQATVYDAVAGRISSQGFIPLTPFTPSGRDTASSSTKPVPPEEVLFRRKRAPTRYEEDDIYFADRNLSSREMLPDSDLLKALHAYASDLYASRPMDRRSMGFKSMDETALIALGLLLEDAAEDVLGERGHLVFLEANDEFQAPKSAVGDGTLSVRSTPPSFVTSEHIVNSEGEVTASDEDRTIAPSFAESESDSDGPSQLKPSK